MTAIFKNAGVVRQALDAVPSIVIVTDEDVRVLYRNLAAKELFKGDKVYNTRAGEAMNCINAASSPGGCGRGPSCGDCVVRMSVNSAFAGKNVRRAGGEARIRAGGKTVTIPILVSAQILRLEGSARAMVVVEDISELTELRSLLPICSACKKIRTPDNTWQEIDDYLKAHSPEIRLTHGICPACMKKLYPEYIPKPR